MSLKAIVFSGLATVASAHIIITNPVPFGKSTLNNSPLDASGSDFPCKFRPGVYELEGASNVYAQGSTQQLEFQGTAVHGGGSCQVSVTTDKEPDKDSVWKVIKSIEGGCPARDTPGNIGDNANAAVPYTYDYTIPEELAAGEYVLAWSWFNKVGNREMYMNCAPLTVTGSGGDSSFFKSLPDLFTANIGNDCGTVSDTDLLFPNPGAAVEKMNGATDAFMAPTGNSCQAGNGGGDPAPAPTTAPSEPAPTSSPEPTPAPTTSKGGIFITVPGDSETSEAPVPTTTVAPPPTDPTPTPEPAPEQPENPSGGFAPGTPCTAEGEWNCVGGSSFQRCASGAWSMMQQLAAGMNCESGQSSELKTAAMKHRRSLRHGRRSMA
jgi:hypothetical protein